MQGVLNFGEIKPGMPAFDSRTPLEAFGPGLGRAGRRRDRAGVLQGVEAKGVLRETARYRALSGTGTGPGPDMGFAVAAGSHGQVRLADRDALGREMEAVTGQARNQLRFGFGSLAPGHDGVDPVVVAKVQERRALVGRVEQPVAQDEAGPGIVPAGMVHGQGAWGGNHGGCRGPG